MGFYPPYQEKTRTGLTLLDDKENPLYSFRYPVRGYAQYEDIPPFIVEALSFIEDRGILLNHPSTLNPAIDWGRFLKAAAFRVGEALSIPTPSMGGEYSRHAN